MHLGGVRWPGWDDDGFLQYMLPPWKAETTQRWYPQQVASHICTRTSRWKVWNLCNSKFRYQRKVWKKSGKIQKPSKVSFELTPYIYIYVRTKSIYSWQMYDKPWNQIPWSFSTPGPYVCRMSCTSTSNGWMNLVVTGAQPGEQPGKAGAALPGGGATARDPKCFLMELWRGCHFFSHDPRKINNFFASDFVASRCWPFRPKLRIVAHNLCSFFFARLQLEVFAEDSGYDRTTFQHRGANVPSDELWAVSLRMFYLGSSTCFFKKLALELFCFWTIGRRNWISSPWATLVSIASIWGKVNSCYLLVYPPAPLLQSLRWRDS